MTEINQSGSNSSQHIMNVSEMENKNKPKYVAQYWYDKLTYLLAIGLFVSILIGSVSFISESFSFLIYLTPLPPIITIIIWLIRRLFHGRDLEPVKDNSY